MVGMQKKQTISLGPQNEMQNVNKKIAIINFLESNNRSVSELSRKTNLKPYQVRNFLNLEPDFFVKIPKTQQYTLNKFGKYKGKRSLMVKALTNNSASYIKNPNIASFIIGFVISYIVFNT